MQKIICLLLIFFWASLAFSQDEDEVLPESYHFRPVIEKPKTTHNPDGRIGDLIITCLGGFQTGNGDITSNNITKKGNADLSGFLIRFKLDAPISKESTFLLRIDFDRESFSTSESNQYIKQEFSIIKILAGIKFYLNP